MFWVGGTLWGEPFYRSRRYGFWFLVSAPKARLAARRAATHFCGSREGGLRCGRVRQAAAIPSGNAVAANMAARASDADRRGRCLSCPSPERLSCQRRALCEYFKYLSPVNSVWIYSVGDRNQLYHNVGGAANARGDLEGTTRSWQGLIARYHTCRSVPRFTRTRR